VDEASTNVMEHAYGSQARGELRVCCYLDGNDFVVRIRDRGRPFDPAQVPDPDVMRPLSERGVGGLGLFFIRRLTDGMSFRTHPDTGNELLLRKRRTGRG